jgi:hypothetical protein
MAPGIHIFSEVAKHTQNSKFAFATYNSLRNPKRRKALQGFDFIYLDEFHRIGAEIWGAAVMEVLDLNSGAKILGTSATPVRYLDNKRDMAIELFHNKIASHLPLNKAIVDGVLRAPKYVSALYSIADDQGRLEQQIMSSAYEDKASLLTHLKQIVVDWERSSGIDTILKKYLNPGRSKIIVFCENVKSMKTAESTLKPILSEIYGDLATLHINSSLADKVNKRTLDFFSALDNIPKILFTVNMVNEGLHGKDIATVILLRETNSPNIFWQQIGRCFSIGQLDQPLIFDLVNNLNNVQINMFKQDYETEYAASTAMLSKTGAIAAVNSNPIPIEFIDYTKEIHDLFISIAETTDYWEIHYKRAEMFFSQYGHVAVPLKLDARLHFWVRSQRIAFKENRLSDDRIRQMNVLCMNWDTDHEYRWYAKFTELKQCLDTNTKLSESLNLWLKSQRDKFEKGTLPKPYEYLLAPLVHLDPYTKNLWKEKLQEAKKHFDTHGSFDLGSRVPLMRDIRHAYKAGTLPDYVIQALSEMGFPFRVNNSWRTNFNLLEAHVKLHGKVMPTIATNSHLTKWLQRQRKSFIKGKLKNEYVALLQPTGVLDGIKTRSRRTVKKLNKTHQL